MEIDNKEITNSVSSRTLRLIDEFLMVMMRLRLGFLLIDLQHRFKVSSGRISRVFTAWIKFMHSCFNELIKKKKIITHNRLSCTVKQMTDNDFGLTLSWPFVYLGIVVIS
jgi:hypothetical protein